jgi:hypothetical protein
VVRIGEEIPSDRWHLVRPNPGSQHLIHVGVRHGDDARGGGKNIFATIAADRSGDGELRHRARTGRRAVGLFDPLRGWLDRPPPCSPGASPQSALLRLALRPSGNGIERAVLEALGQHGRQHRSSSTVEMQAGASASAYTRRPHRL